MNTKTLTVDDEDLEDEEELEPPLVDAELPPLEVPFEEELEPPPAAPSSLRASKSASVGGPSRTMTCSALEPTVFEAAEIYACIVVKATLVVKFA
jgi:hypothetical protein